MANNRLVKTTVASAKVEMRFHATLRKSADSAYRLSRIQAEGWNAAHRVPSATMDAIDASKIESLNPYASDPERARWRAGFTGAFKP